MPQPSIERRVEKLEETVASLAGLPERVMALESQIVQFRSDVGVEFSAIREEMRQIREEIRAGDEETRRFMRVLHEDLVARIAVIGEGSSRRKRR